MSNNDKNHVESNVKAIWLVRDGVSKVIGVYNNSNAAFSHAIAEPICGGKFIAEVEKIDLTNIRSAYSVDVGE